MVLISIRMHTKCCLENGSKKCLRNVFLKVVFEKGVFVMVLVFMRTHTKRCLLKMFQNESVGV